MSDWYNSFQLDAETAANAPLIYRYRIAKRGLAHIFMCTSLLLPGSQIPALHRKGLFFYLSFRRYISNSFAAMIRRLMY